MNARAADIFDIHHGRTQIAVSQPFLQRADADTLLQRVRCEGVSKFVQEPLAAVRSLAAFVTVFRSAPPTVEARATCDSLQLVFQFLVRPSFGGRKDEVVTVESGLPCLVFPQCIEQGSRHGNLPLLLVLRLETQLLLSGNPDASAIKVDVGP